MAISLLFEHFEIVPYIYLGICRDEIWRGDLVDEIDLRLIIASAHQQVGRRTVLGGREIGSSNHHLSAFISYAAEDSPVGPRGYNAHASDLGIGARPGKRNEPGQSSTPPASRSLIRLSAALASRLIYAGTPFLEFRRIISDACDFRINFPCDHRGVMQ